LGDALRGLARPDTGLDFLGAQRILHFDLVLAEAGELAAYSGAETVVDGQHETSAMAGAGEHQVGAVLAHGHEAKLGHRPSFRVPSRGGLRTRPPRSPIAVCRHLLGGAVSGMPAALGRRPVRGVLHVWPSAPGASVPQPARRSRLSASRPVALAPIGSCPGWSAGPSRSLPLPILARRHVGDREHSWGMSPIPYKGLRGDGI